MPPRDGRGEQERVGLHRPPARVSELTRREQQILQLVSTGATNVEIGEALGLTPNTVKTYWQRVLGKLGARNRAHAVAKAYELRLLDIS
jgi:two-component system, NarL family, nitrate/nitrite response regulator NarL